MNIDSFIKTSKFISNLKSITNNDEDEYISAFIYLDNYYIYDKTPLLDFYLILENCEYISKNIFNLEEKLYEYCKQIGALE